MIARRYGSVVQSVQPNFDSRAMTEVAFLRTSDLSLPADEFFQSYERVEGHELTAAAEGAVKDEAEQALLAHLRQQLLALDAAAEDGVLLVENSPGNDYPKTRDRTTTLVVAGENRLYFRWTVDPPLRVGVYRRRSD